MKPIPIDSGDFVEIRTASPQKLYVDKTAYFHKVITDPQARRFFLARPRRYAAPYAAAGKPVWVIGLAFSKRARRLVDHCVAEYRPRTCRRSEDAAPTEFQQGSRTWR